MENIHSFSASHNQSSGKVKLPHFLALASLMFIMFFSLSSCEKSNDDPADNGSNPIDTTNMSMKYMDLSGNSVSLSDYKGKVLVLFFFGYSCPYCIAAAPDIESELYKPFISNSNFVLLGLDVWDGSKSNVQTFKTRTNVTFPLILEASGIAKSFNTTYDRILVVDKAGTVVFKGNQNAAGDIAAARVAIENALK